jgi:phytanoyl-CoA hydroxylase
MTDKEIKETYERDGYVVAKDIIFDHELEPIRAHIKKTVGEYARQQYAEGNISSLYETESFERRYAAICEELSISPRNWMGNTYGREFYNLYNLPGVLRILNLIHGTEISNIGSPALRTKLPGSVITSFPWHQDSQYIDQSTIGKKERHTASLQMVTVWVPLVEATVENGCCWVIGGSHRWGLLDGARGSDNNVRMEEDVERRGNPVAVPLKPGGALFMSNLCVHTSKLNTTNGCRWSIDFRYFPTPDRSDLTLEQRQASEFVHGKVRRGGREPLVVLTRGHKPTWEEWDAANRKLQSAKEQ